MSSLQQYQTELKKLETLKEKAAEEIENQIQEAVSEVRRLEKEKEALTGKSTGRGKGARSPETIEKMRLAAQKRWAKVKTK